MRLACLYHHFLTTNQTCTNPLVSSRQSAAAFRPINQIINAVSKMSTQSVTLINMFELCEIHFIPWKIYSWVLNHMQHHFIYRTLVVALDDWMLTLTTWVKGRKAKPTDVFNMFISFILQQLLWAKQSEFKLDLFCLFLILGITVQNYPYLSHTGTWCSSQFIICETKK